MSTIQQPCPSCARLLELPSSAVGRLAQCPACNARFTVQDSVEQQAEVVAAAEDDDRSPRTSAQIETAAQGKTVAEDAAAEQNPFSAPLESGMAAPPSVNPYEPSGYVPTPVAEIDQLQIVPRTLEEIFSPTMSIFGARWGFLLLAFLIVLVIGFLGIGFPFIGLIALTETLGDVAGGLAMLVLFPLGMFFSAYISVGLARNAIAVARNSPSPLAELFPPLVVVVRFLLGAFALTALIGVVGGVFVGLVAALVRVGGNEAIASILLATGLISGTALMMVGYWLLWSWIFIVSDGKSTALGSIKAAWTLTMHNKATSILLVIIAVVLSTAGTSACYVGLLITQPITNLMFAVAYLLITNQKIDDPRMHQVGPSLEDW